MVKVLNDNTVSETIMGFFLNISSKTEITPQGFMAVLELVNDCIVAGYNGMTQKIFKNCLKMLCSFLRENQLLAIQEWPVECGGGMPVACEITTQILKIFNIPFNTQSMEREVEAISSELAKSDIIYLTLNALRYINAENISAAVTLIAKLVFSAEHSKTFAQQFVTGSGLAIIAKYKLLAPDKSATFIIDTLSLIS